MRTWYDIVAEMREAAYMDWLAQQAAENAEILHLLIWMGLGCFLGGLIVCIVWHLFNTNRRR